MMTPRTREMTMTWGKRLLLVALVLVGIFYFILSMAERNKDAIRKGLEDYLSQATGHPAQITDMTTVKLTPDLVFRMSGIVIRDKNDGEKTLVSADKAYISMPLWKMFLGMQDLIGFEIQNLDIATGFFLPKKVEADFVGISDPSPDKAPANFVVEGAYNGQPLLITAEMARRAEKEHYQYKFDAPFPMTFKLGALEGSGLFDRSLNTVTFKQVQIVHGGNRAEFVLRDIHKNFDGAAAEGTMNDVPFKGVIRNQNDVVTLSITPESQSPEDLKKVAAFVTAVQTDLGIDDSSAIKIIVNGAATETTKETE